MKAMKAKSAMKSSMKRAMKSKRVAKIARGKRARSQVLKGKKEKTVGGLTSSQLMKNSYGKVVSKSASQAKKKAYAGSKFQKWIKAVQQARKELNVKGFVGVGGKTAVGKSLYAKAKAIYTAA